MLIIQVGFVYLLPLSLKSFFSKFAAIYFNRYLELFGIFCAMIVVAWTDRPDKPPATGFEGWNSRLHQIKFVMVLKTFSAVTEAMQAISCSRVPLMSPPS